MILASLLEYSDYNLTTKLERIKAGIDIFTALENGHFTTETNPKSKDKTIYLHLDFVCKQFAQSRKVMKSMDLHSVFEHLHRHFKNQKLVLSVHIMGESFDITEQIRELFTLNLDPKWDATFFVPFRLANTFEDIFVQKNLEFGLWLDKDEWQSIDFDKYEEKNFLLMTVFAGKSGQKLDPQIKKDALEIVKDYPDKNFILDGGWSVEKHSQLKNLQIVSYSSFWQKFNSLLKNETKN